MRNFSGVCFLFLFVCSITSALALGPTRDKAVNSPSSENFLRRAYHASVVLGDYLYIDGGELSQLVDGVPDDGFESHNRPNNITLSIDLSSSWKNATVAINLVPKGLAPILNHETLWKTPDRNSCFLWAGETSLLIYGSPPLEVWKFNIDNLGGGTWSPAPSSDTLFPHLLRQSTGCGVANGDTGFYTGGYTSGKTDFATSGQANIGREGIVSLNMTSGAWSNDSTIGLDEYGMIQSCVAVTLPAIGLDRSLIIILGDWGPPLWASQILPSRQMSLNNITIYDPHIGVWFSQTATGTIPGNRGNFCAVSIPGDNGTYEIFIYSGEISSTRKPYDEIYVLSIPGFVWFKADYPPQSPRIFHTCEVVGRRQLVTIGGLNHHYSPSIPNVWDVKDTFSQGLGIFDMTDMVWKDSYDANASDYRSPEVVKDWYAAGNQNSVNWQSKQVAISVNPTQAYIVPSTSPSTPTSSSTGLALSDRIALATSISFGVPGVAVAILGLYLTWRHYKNKAKNATVHQEETSPSPAEAESNPEPNTSSELRPANSLPSNSHTQLFNTGTLINGANAEASTRAETATGRTVVNNPGLRQRSGSI
ncbi:hypothetical protein BGZ57DRAFT_912299 [Hyaloscypha finlandica]|nr:hypothetical protein BGZ57DRAFT_912299 [Hyaloscypha finlandica]